MIVLKFKTNIDSETQLKEVKKSLDTEEVISRWNIDLKSEEKILSVSGKEITPDLIVNLLQEKGYTAEVLRVFAIGGHDL